MPSTKLVLVGLALLIAAVTAKDLTEDPARRGKAVDDRYQTVDIRGSEDGNGSQKFAVIGGACPRVNALIGSLGGRAVDCHASLAEQNRSYRMLKAYSKELEHIQYPTTGVASRTRVRRGAWTLGDMHPNLLFESLKLTRSSTLHSGVLACARIP